MCWRLLKSSGGGWLIIGKPRTYNPFMSGISINSSCHEVQPMEKKKNLKISSNHILKRIIQFIRIDY